MRKTKEITIEKGRDKGKTFLITEKSALDTERFMMKVLLGIGHNIDIGGVMASYASGQVLPDLQSIVSLIFSMDQKEFEPLYEELLSCVQFRFKAGNAMQYRAVDMYDFEDISTVLLLRKEVIALHINFTEGENK